MIRTPTFFVPSTNQQANLAALTRREQRLAEVYVQNKPLGMHGSTYQKTHPVKAQKGRKDADATVATHYLVGVADGVSQIEDFGIDASELPQELLKHCKQIASAKLRPDAPDGTYTGPIPVVREAFERTKPILGSTTLLLGLLDNGTRIHGKLHPMIGVISIGDCEMLVFRRLQGQESPLSAVFQTEMQRIDGHLQTPLQLARVDARIDPHFHEAITIEVIEKGSAVHCISAYEGDLLVMGSDGVFDNLFTDEVADIVNSVLRPNTRYPADEALLSLLARRIVEACHAKTRPGPTGFMPDAPIGRGGKVDDTSCVVSEVVALTDIPDAWAPSVHNRIDDDDGDGGVIDFLRCGAMCNASEQGEVDIGDGTCRRAGRQRRRQQQRHRARDSSEDDDDRNFCNVT